MLAVGKQTFQACLKTLPPKYGIRNHSVEEANEKLEDAHLLGDDIRRVGEVDAATFDRVRLAHLGRAVGERHHTRTFLDDQGLVSTK